jgi:hypothetical protein
MSPRGVQSPRAGALDPTRPDPTTTTLLLATSASNCGELAAALENLRARGVTKPDEFAALGADVIDDTIRWFDAQDGRVGAGVLVNELRAGGKPGWTPQASRSASVADTQREYGESITAWLTKHLPELDRPGWGPHPAAVAAVIRIHHRDGKTALSKSKHAAEIRQAVRDWVAKWGE